MVKAKGGICAMDLGIARLCLDCEEIFEGKSRCPRSDSKTWHPIMGWIRPMGEAERRLVRWKDFLQLAERRRIELSAGTVLSRDPGGTQTKSLKCRIEPRRIYSIHLALET
jgi:hypothetical protein